MESYVLHDIGKAEVGGEEIALLRSIKLEREVLDERLLENVDPVVLQHGNVVERLLRMEALVPSAQVGELSLPPHRLVVQIEKRQEPVEELRGMDRVSHPSAALGSEE